MTATTNRPLASLLVCLLGAMVVWWWSRGELVNYLHPRTIWLTAAGGALLAILALVAIVGRRHPRPTTFQLAVLFLVVGLMAVVDPAPLSFALVQQRHTADAVPVTSRGQVDFSKLSEQFTILDWQNAWASDPTHRRYLDKRVRVTGFVIADEESYAVGRLVITCCAIDARPVWLALDSPSPLPPAGTWVTIEGTMAIAGSDPLVRVTRVTRVDPPANPYLY
jgi:putative membrane protein